MTESIDHSFSDLVLFIGEKKGWLQLAKRVETGRRPAGGAAGTFASECHGYSTSIFIKSLKIQ